MELDRERKQREYEEYQIYLKVRAQRFNQSKNSIINAVFDTLYTIILLSPPFLIFYITTLFTSKFSIQLLTTVLISFFFYKLIFYFLDKP